jgi:hypothetical protein
MSLKIKKNLHFLKVLKDVNEPSRKVILKNANRDLINSINECIYNILYNRQFILNKHKKAQLVKYKHSLRKLVNKKTSFNKRKKIIVQSGGSFLPIILPTILSVLSSYLTQ